MKVLLVEDQVAQASVTTSFLELERTDCVVWHVTTVTDAVSALLNESFDVILLDLGLPDGEGLEVVITVAEVAQATPIVILTAQGEEGLGPVCVQAGASDFLSKRDLTPESLARAVNYAVSRKSESILHDLSRVVQEFHSLSDPKGHACFEQLRGPYSKLIREPRFLMTEDHQQLARLMGKQKVSGGQAIALHTQCLESVCREADERDQARYLDNCRVVLAATLSYLVDFYRENGNDSPR